MKNKYNIKIEKLIPGGQGLGKREDGMVVLVPYVLPGEVVQISEVLKKKSYVEARLLEIIKASPDRREPSCAIYGKCGGCDLQHAVEPAQLQIKKDMLLESLTRSGAVDSKAMTSIVSDPLPSPESFGYRQRIRLHVDEDEKMGYYRYHSHEVEPTHVCPLARPEINTVLKKLHTSQPMFDLLQQTEELELLLNPDTENVIIYLHFKRKPRPNDRKLAEDVCEAIDDIAYLMMDVKGHGKFGPFGSSTIKPGFPAILKTSLDDKSDREIGTTLTWEAGGFCQVNLEQNKQMVKQVMELVGAGSSIRILDLFCGMGNFSIPLARVAASVVGMDGQGSAIRSAKRNAELNGINNTNCNFEKIPVPVGVKKLIDQKETFDIIILDPPRQGALEIIPYLSTLKPEKIIYISCDPATLARDLSLLTEHAYCISSIIPIDMFPQTHHMESIVLLENNNSEMN